MSKNKMIMLPREVVERALAALDAEDPYRAAVALRVALEQSQGEQAPVALQPFNTWSSNEGDSWHDFPTDAQIIEDVFGGETPVVGTEYEVSAGWRCVTATYRITWVSEDGDCEVECISHKQEISAPQPPEHYDQQALDLCLTCGWKTMIPGDCCLHCARQKPPAVEQPPKLYPLPADLYDSKDWRSGTYAERVEWLHTMYESAKEQIAELERPKPKATPYLYYDPNNGDTWTQEAINDGCCPPDGLIALYTKEKK